MTLLLGSRAAGSGAGRGVFEMGTSLDIKIKRANKVYHSGVSGVGGPAGFTVSGVHALLGVPGRGRGAPPAACGRRGRRRRCSAHRRAPGTSASVLGPRLEPSQGPLRAEELED